MSHTPGPWAILANEIRAGDLLIAEVLGGEGTRFIEEDQNAECFANAHLIAAAPDLLAACMFVVNDAEPGEDARLTVEGYNRLCAAIARAEGQAHA